MITESTSALAAKTMTDGSGNLRGTSSTLATDFFFGLSLVCTAVTD